MDNPNKCDHILQISIRHFIEDPIETNSKIFLNTPKHVKNIKLVNYKDGKFSGWIPNLIRFKEYVKIITK